MKNYAQKEQHENFYLIKSDPSFYFEELFTVQWYV